MYEHILIAFDLGYEEQLPLLIAPARRLLGKRRGKIHFLYVDESQVHHATYPILDEENAKRQQTIALYRLKSLISQYVPEQQQGECMVKHGHADERILEIEKKIKPDFIVMMAGKPGLGQYFMGANTNKVVRHAKSSVIIIRP
ncbi:universal stress protein [Celerinatantimonas sp. YJH-8]|uniref:universal stress protein n=1 Tax=Celerinatantimonas sp. YJH-8 TaxID=3228714 RepID=UPI0038C158E1